MACGGSIGSLFHVMDDKVAHVQDIFVDGMVVGHWYHVVRGVSHFPELFCLLKGFCFPIVWNLGN